MVAIEEALSGDLDGADGPRPELTRLGELLDERRLALLDYALLLTRAPATIVREDVERLRTAGLDDTDVLHLAEVVAYYAYVNRIADGLGVALEGAED